MLDEEDIINIQRAAIENGFADDELILVYRNYAYKILKKQKKHKYDLHSIAFRENTVYFHVKCEEFPFYLADMLYSDVSHPYRVDVEQKNIVDFLITINGKKIKNNIS